MLDSKVAKNESRYSRATVIKDDIMIVQLKRQHDTEFRVVTDEFRTMEIIIQLGSLQVKSVS
jgi:hypothetical protein